MPTPIPDDLDFLEITADNGGQSVAAFSLEGSKAAGTFLLKNPPDEEGEYDPVDAEQITDTIEYLLGSTALEPGDGRVQRTLPKAHPLFPFLYVSAIPAITGIGQFSFEAADDTLEAPPLPYYALYDQYQFRVEFTNRPYALLQDYNIPLVKGTYFNDAGTPTPYLYAKEWLRFTDFILEPQANFIVPNQGQQSFRTTGGVASPTNPNGVPFSNPPRMYLPDQLLKVMWYQIPYRYVSSSNSYLEKFKGRINQAAWYEWGAGELLYLNYNVRRYTPPVPEIFSWYDGTVSTEKLCNIEMQFLLTRRPGTDAPTPTNPSFIAAGHNLLPWLATRKFYYCTNEVQGVAPLAQTPTWLSFPIEKLFTDPDTQQP